MELGGFAILSEKLARSVREPKVTKVKQEIDTVKCDWYSFGNCIVIAIVVTGIVIEASKIRGVRVSTA